MRDGGGQRHVPRRPTGFSHAADRISERIGRVRVRPRLFSRSDRARFRCLSTLQRRGTRAGGQREARVKLPALHGRPHTRSLDGKRERRSLSAHQAHLLRWASATPTLNGGDLLRRRRTNSERAGRSRTHGACSLGRIRKVRQGPLLLSKTRRVSPFAPTGTTKRPVCRTLRERGSKPRWTPVESGSESG